MVPPIKEEEPVANLDDIDVKKPDDAALAEELQMAEEAKDEVVDLPDVPLVSASQAEPTPSQLSQMSGKTYIS